jgi:hypothetical protein
MSTFAILRPHPAAYDKHTVSLPISLLHIPSRDGRAL